MATTVKITTVGNSAGIVLPREVMEKLHVEKGDKLFLTETPDQMTAYRTVWWVLLNTTEFAVNH